ncbi:MAG: class I SAM-dependent methyltransferase [Candidatus Omnitrophica bacterium]|nr:class I SAM-dependent methyltransferase [Candidatus Omnitrophota bacterium]
MQEDFSVKYLDLEDRHWWFAGRRDMVLRLVDDLPKESCILDVGCSGGAMLLALLGKGFRDVAGVDISVGAIESCRNKGLKNTTVMDAQELTFADGSFDAVIASDILEHLADPARALASWRRVLKPGGKLLVFVPAYTFLWSDHDVINCHQKRYEKKDFADIVRQAGFEVQRTSGWDVVLFVPIALMVLLRPRKTGAGYSDKAGNLHAVPGWLNGILTRLLLLENMALSHMNAPAGISFFVVASKKD